MNVASINEKMKLEKLMLHLERMELFDAFSKQQFLVDNLKRQIVCLEIGKLIKWREKEFLQILNWKNSRINKNVGKY